MTEPATIPAQARYSTGAIVLHWALAFGMLLQLALGLTMGEGRTPESFARFQLHKSVGITILLLTLVRFGWRLAHRPPPMLVHGWEARAAKIVHTLFYALLVLLPLTGWLLVSASPTHIPTLLYGAVPWPNIPGFEAITAARGEAIGGAAGEVHEWLAWIAILAIALHVAGALKHQLADRDGTLARMAPGTRGGFDARLVLIGAGVLAAVVLGLAAMPGVQRGAIEAGPAVEDEAAVEAEANVTAPAPSPAATPAPAALANETAAEDAAAEEEGALATWRVQKGGRLGFATSWSGSALTGSFGDWDADIAFGDAALDQSRVKVTIRTGSARTGQEQPDATLPGEEWFATAMFPTATFEASKFRKTGAGRYVASGTLTIKGKRRPLSLPFTLRIDGDTARMRGSATIDRTAYGVGFAGTEEVPAEVRINVSLTAKKAK